MVGLELEVVESTHRDDDDEGPLSYTFAIGTTLLL